MIEEATIDEAVSFDFLFARYSKLGIYKAYVDALAGDPVSAFGGILISNTKIDVATANEIHELFCEVSLQPAS